MAEALSGLSDQDLVQRIVSLEREMVDARFRHSMNMLEDTASLRRLRRSMARLRTEQTRRERDAGLAKGQLVAGQVATPADDASAAAAPAEKGGFLKGIVDKLTGAE